MDFNRKAPGKAPKLNDEHRAFPAAAAERGPDPEADGVVRWRLADLAGLPGEKFGVSVDETTVGRELRKLGFRKLSARPQHYAQKAGDIEAFKKNSLPVWRRSGRGSRKIRN